MNEWLQPPDILTLSHDEVHVWRVALALVPLCVEDLGAGLPADEQQRAKRFHFTKGREEFVLARASLRAILGRYLSKKPGDLLFSYGAHGKPVLADPGPSAVRFNVSHSDGLVLHAVAFGREVGVDLERIGEDFSVEPLAQRFFSARENAALHAIASDKRREAFFACWTRKEAFIKAIGEGFSHPLDQFDVMLDPGQPAALLETRRDPQEAERWSLRELTAGPDYKAAIAVQGRNWQLKCWNWLG